MSKHDTRHDPGPAAHAGPAHDAPAHDHPTRSTFVTIWLVLGFLTVVEVFVPRIYSAPWNHNTRMLLLVILASGKAGTRTYRLRNCAGEYRWIEDRVVPRLTRSGQVTEIEAELVRVREALLPHGSQARPK